MTDLDKLPPGLGPAGKALWKTTVGLVVIVSAGERAILEQACRLSDLAEKLEKMVAERPVTATVAELRKCRGDVARLCAQLVPVREDGTGPSASEMARKLALRRSNTGRAS